MRNLKQEFINEVVYNSIQELQKLDKFSLDDDVKNIAIQAASQQYEDIASKAQEKLNQVQSNPSIDDKNKISMEVRNEVVQLLKSKNESVKVALEEYTEGPAVQFLDQKGKPKESKEEKNELIREFVSRTMLEKIRDHKTTSLADLAFTERMQAKPMLSEEKKRSIASTSFSSPKESRRFSFRRDSGVQQPPKWAAANVEKAVNAVSEASKNAVKEETKIVHKK